MTYKTGRPPEDGWYWMEYDGGRRRIERYGAGDKYNYLNYAELVGWIGPLRPEDAEELERLKSTVVAKEKTLCHYEEQIAEDTQRIEELESQLATAREEIATLKSECSNHELSSEAIVEARAYLVEHLGSECECAFFDDCIHNAVALCLVARTEVARLREGLAKLMDGNKDDIYTRIEKLLKGGE